MTNVLTKAKKTSEDVFLETTNEIDDMIFLSQIKEYLEKLKVEPSKKCIENILTYAKSKK